MIKAFAVKKPSGEIAYMVSVGFTINPIQVILVCDFDPADGPIEKIQVPPGYDSLKMGKLSDQLTLLFNRIIFEMEKVNWNFSKYPDPDIILITKINYHA
jgi:hypothetical protein